MVWVGLNWLVESCLVFAIQGSTHASILEFSAASSKNGAFRFTFWHIASHRAREQAGNRFRVIFQPWICKHLVVIFLSAIFHNAKTVTNGPTY